MWQAHDFKKKNKKQPNNIVNLVVPFALWYSGSKHVQSIQPVTITVIADWLTNSLTSPLLPY